MVFFIMFRGVLCGICGRCGVFRGVRGFNVCGGVVIGGCGVCFIIFVVVFWVDF